MNHTPASATSDCDALWLGVSPSLKPFDGPLLRYLSQQVRLAHWEYRQTLDEASCLETAVVLLHEYLNSRSAPVHLIGHGMGGVLGLTYARRYPGRVRSLTLLAVAAQPAAIWQAHYYVQRQLLPCSQSQVLAQMVRSLFGTRLPYPAHDLVTALARDLEAAPSPHSLLKLVQLEMGEVARPLLVCGSHTDPVVSPTMLQDWQAWLKPTDRLVVLPDGRHFFHWFYPELVGAEVVRFWQSAIAPTSVAASASVAV